jgi:hypothetical protein
MQGGWCSDGEEKEGSGGDREQGGGDRGNGVSRAAPSITDSNGVGNVVFWLADCLLRRWRWVRGVCAYAVLVTVTGRGDVDVDGPEASGQRRGFRFRPRVSDRDTREEIV